MEPVTRILLCTSPTRCCRTAAAPLVSEGIACAGVTLSQQLVPSCRASLLLLLPGSASACLWVNPADTFLNAEKVVLVAAATIPSGATQTTFRMIRQLFLQP